MSFCKKHGKERNVICISKRGRNGTPFEYVGCEDCKAGLPPKAKASSQANGKPTNATSEQGGEATPPRALKKGRLSERFGFKF